MKEQVVDGPSSRQMTIVAMEDAQFSYRRRDLVSSLAPMASTTLVAGVKQNKKPWFFALESPLCSLQACWPHG